MQELTRNKKIEVQNTRLTYTNNKLHW